MAAQALQPSVSYSPSDAKRKSGRCIATWYGTDSFGRHYCYAMREDGAFFSQAYKFNGHGMGWSSWIQEEDPRAMSKGHAVERRDLAWADTGDEQWIGGGFVSGPRISVDSNYWLPGVSSKAHSADMRRIRLPVCPAFAGAKVYGTRN